MKLRQFSAALLALPFLLAGCGGGGSDESRPSAQVSSVYVFGDSLQDVGTFGLKFTVNGPNSKIWPELIAQTYGATAQCNYYAPVSPSPLPVARPDTTCTNYAVGNSRINTLVFEAGLGVPAQFRGNTAFSVPAQLREAGAKVAFGDKDLLLIDGGGNDSADLAEALLVSQGDNFASFATLLGSLGVAFDPAALQAQGQAYVVAQGTLYMQALADSLVNTIKDQALAKGATRVAVINIPNILQTPDFKAVLAANPGAAAVSPVITLWIEAFNARLASAFANEKRVAVVDFYTEFNRQIEMPAQFGLVNAEDPVCNFNADTLTNFALCTEANVSAVPGKPSADWWTRHAFSDGFHPTPYGHQLVSQLISRSLARAGWL